MCYPDFRTYLKKKEIQGGTKNSEVTRGRYLQIKLDIDSWSWYRRFSERMEGFIGEGLMKINLRYLLNFDTGMVLIIEP